MKITIYFKNSRQDYVNKKELPISVCPDLLSMSYSAHTCMIYKDK